MTFRDPVCLLEDMIAIRSLSGEEGPLARYLVQAMEERGFRARVDEVGNAVGERGEGPAEIVLLGHMDTVAGEVPVRTEGDLLYGRGAVDAKGPLAAFIAAAAEAEVPPGWRLVVVGAVEEEAATSAGARHLISRHSPAAVIIGEPSGWDRVTVGYKGRLLIDYELAADAAHSAREEETVCERAFAYWSWVKGFSITRSSAHAKRFDKVDPALRAINSSGDGLQERVKMEIALRLPVDFDVAAFRRPAQGAAGAAKIEFRGYEPAFRAEKNTPVVRALLAGIREQGGEPRFSVKSGTSDMNVVGPAWGCPIVAYGPGDPDLDHTPNEHINIPEYRRAIQVLRLALERLPADPAATG